LLTVAGINMINLTDTITNFGFKASPYTVLYHMNFGYPLLSEEAELVIDPELTLPRDETAESGISEFRQFSKPQANFREQVFDHKMKSAIDGRARVTLKNKSIGISLSIDFDTSTLPYLVQWKMMGQGEYVLGLEPANIPGKNRKVLKEEKMLPYLQPGESIINKIRIILEDLS